MPLQEVLRLTPNGGRISLQLNYAASPMASPQGPAQPAASLVAASLQGIMKAAAAELGSNSISTFIRDATSPAGNRRRERQQQQPEPDVHGTLCYSGQQSAPRLLLSEERSSSMHDAGAACSKPGQLVITGGLGALGSLVTVWLAKLLGPGTCLHVLGRSGRAADAHGSSCLPQAGQVRQ